MKKLFIFSIALFSLIAFSAVPVFAMGSLQSSAADQAQAQARDFGYRIIPAGGAVGGSQATGAAEGDADVHGWNIYGKSVANTDVQVVGGGLSDTNAYRFHPGIGDHSIGVGSSSSNYAVTGAMAKIKAKNLFFGPASAHISGEAHQGSDNCSIIGPSPRYFRFSNGISTGRAGQSSSGGFEGEAGENWWIYTENGRAKIKAQIEMEGGSYSESYRWVEKNGGVKTEGMGTNVGTFTEVVATGRARIHGGMWGYVDGGYNGSGSARAAGIQQTHGGLATGTASGSYCFWGNLNSTAGGSANGYQYTSITKVNGMHGSIARAGSGMHVTVHSSGSCCYGGRD